jgi:hypothetical protein
MSKLSLSVQKAALVAEYGPSVAVARLAQADRAIASAIGAIDAVRLVRDAKRLEEDLRAIRAGEGTQRQAAVFVLRAKRNAGQRLAEAQARGEVATQARGGGGNLSGVGNGDTTPPATLADIGLTRDQSSEWKELAAEWSDEALTAAAEEMERPSLAGIQARAPGMFSSDTPEWYTPPHIVRAVVEVLGSIDLDPCAEAGPVKGIPAETHYTLEEDGLSQGWRGRVYMNPPYGREIVAWVDKLAEEHKYGNVTEAIALVPARVDTTWWRRLPFTEWAAINGRLAFSGHENAAPFPSAACYLGPNWQRFREVFAPLGDGYTRWDLAA